MNPDYIHIFNQRGHPYHAAMLSQPHARDAEFDALFAWHPLAQGESVLDVPAGGGYLARHLGAAAHVTSLEITPGFSDGIEVVSPEDLSRWSGLDRAVCLAALHHFGDAIAFLSRLGATLRPGGMLHVADVMAGSPLCDFLDGFVGRYNSTGHAGRYLPGTASHYAGLGDVLRCEETPCPWVFPDEAHMLRFCNDLFGLHDCPSDALREALADRVGWSTDAQGIRLHWRLLYLDIRRMA